MPLPAVGLAATGYPLVFGPAAGASLKVAARAALDYGPALSSVSLASVLAKEAWKRIPSWIKEDVAFPGSGRRQSKGGKGNEDGDEDDGEDDDDDNEGTAETIDDTEMSSLTAVVQKLQSLAAVGSEKLAQDNCDSNRLTNQQLQASVLAYIQLASQLRKRQPQARDMLYQQDISNDCNIGSDDTDPSLPVPITMEAPDQTVDWPMLKEMLDFAVWAYDEDAELLRSKLEEVDYYLLRHRVVAANMPPGYVGHYMAICPKKKSW
jgi:hypothetical protein